MVIALIWINKAATYNRTLPQMNRFDRGEEVLEETDELDSGGVEQYPSVQGLA